MSVRMVAIPAARYSCAPFPPLPATVTSSSLIAVGMATGYRRDLGHVGTRMLNATVPLRPVFAHRDPPVG
ncbi:MAG: hypothetical protein ONB23_12030 [candidate division KSB1 bacterium]|nr:hypothetical protein [candidate division KSB1 bacterium]